ncbi:MAG: hypothetical protein Q4D51_14290 [Eubacteriales bacterium]|nr:hypothetical protein [Eubacteriales bacterium]
MIITRDNYSSYAKLVQQLGGGKLNPIDEYGTDYGNYSLRFTPTNRPFIKPNWDNIMTKRDKPAMSEAEFDEAIKDLARKEFVSGKKDREAYRKLCMKHGETVSPDRKAIYDESMKKTGGKMNGACMFWDKQGNKTLSYHPISGSWDAINTEEEFARAREFTATYNDELKRLTNKYGEKSKGNISYKQIMNDLGRDRSSVTDSLKTGSIDIMI